MTKISALLTVSMLSVGLLSGCLSTVDTPSKLEQSIAGDQRSLKNKARDIYRHPKETLEFFDFNSSLTVVEIAPGSGWYAEVIAPALKGTGIYYGAHFPDTNEDNYFSKSRKKAVAKVAEHEAFSEVIFTDFTPGVESTLAPEGTVDLVVTFRNLHNWKEEGTLQVFKDAHRALKKGGILGVVEHRMSEEQNFADNPKTGYFPQALAIKLAEQAGFTLVATSEVNANPQDTKNHEKGVWTLPPVLRAAEEDKPKYLAIGESDRMTLKFIK